MLQNLFPVSRVERVAIKVRRPLEDFIVRARLADVSKPPVVGVDSLLIRHFLPGDGLPLDVQLVLGQPLFERRHLGLQIADFGDHAQLVVHVILNFLVHEELLLPADGIEFTVGSFSGPVLHLQFEIAIQLTLLVQ